MDRNSNKYTIIYAIIMVVVVAVILSVAATGLKEKQDNNVAIEGMQNILRSVKIDASTTEARDIFAKTITESFVVKSTGEIVEGTDAFKVNLGKESKQSDSDRLLPIYIADMGSKGKKYIVPLYGAGLWGPIWGFISLNDDMKSIYGANFDHQGETPGLGAEISTEAFEAQFNGKVFIDGTKFTVAKAGEKSDKENSVDALSGATITCKSVQRMVRRDISLYQGYFNKISK